MGIKRYFATADNTITNAFKDDLTTRATGSNMGQSDILEVFSIYGQSTTSSVELSRALIQFPIDQVSTDRSNSTIAASGSVKFYLKMFNARHFSTLPRDYKIQVAGVNGAWEEGRGLDMANYSDETKDNIGSNWIRRTGSTSWTEEGGDFYKDSRSNFNQTLDIGNEDLEIDVTPLVEQWINSSGNVLGAKTNNGFLVKLSGSYEGYDSASNLTGATESYYTKKFFARSSDNFYKRPILEARWDSATKDQRGQFYFSSSLASATDNLNTIYLYNYVRGRLANIPGIDGQSAAGAAQDEIYVSIFSGSSDDSAPFGPALRLSADGTHVSLGSGNNYVVTGGWVSTGIYSASFAYTGSSTLETIYDVWWSGSASPNNTQNSALDTAAHYHTGSIKPKHFNASNINPSGKYIVSMPDLNKTYYYDQTERFRLYVRNKNWSPNIYTVAQTTPDTLTIESASYQVIRTVDQQIVVDYGTGSGDNNYSMLSYDVSGNYFDFDMSLLEPGYTYAFKFSFYEDSVSSYRQQPYLFKFKVEKDEY